MPLVNEVELAKALSRDRMAIRKAVAAGRLTQRQDGLFDLDAAIAEFNATTHHEKGHNNRSGSTAKGDQPAAAPAELSTDPELPKPEQTRAMTYATARATREVYEARIKKLRYEERAGALTPTADVESARFTEFRTLREACLNVPARISAQLAGESDIGRCQQLIADELTGVFQAFSDGQL